jgi:CHASE2 domain-containing sensor protein
MNRKNRLFHRDVWLTAVLTFILIGLLSLLFYSTKFLNPIYNSLKDFEITDIYYSTYRTKTSDYSEDIVLVNIGDADREMISKVLDRIQNVKPKVIGIDVSFPELKNNEIDGRLKKSLSKDNLILASQIQYADGEGHHAHRIKSLKSNEFFQVSGKEGYGNFLGEKNSTVRYYCPFVIGHDGSRELAFTTRIIKKFSPEKSDILLKRDCDSEIINFGLKKYITIEIDQLLQDAKLADVMKGKCVLLGYMGNYGGAKVLDDLHVTPMNKSFGGVSIPDTYGVEIHADILSMILEKNYINESSTVLKWIIMVILCVLHLYVFAYFYVKKHIWFHVVAKSVQIISFGVLSFLAIGSYHWFNYKLEPSLLLVAVILSVDSLYFMEGIMAFFHKRNGADSYFISDHH